jgi:hypothetical protein
MALKDRLSDTLGAMLGGILGVATDSLAKANASTMRSDEPANRPGSVTAMVSPDGKAASLPPEPSGEDPQGLLHDPFALIDQLGFRDRPTGLTYTTLRQMARKMPVYKAILQTRIIQVASFGQRQTDDRSPGFGVILRDEKATPTKQDKIRMSQLEDWMLQTGSLWAPGRDDFKTFLKKMVRDSLVLDQGCFEVVRNRKGDPAEFYALDGATIRLADVPPSAQAQQDPEEVKYVQVYDEVIISEFSGQDLCFGVRNPRTDIRANGYGYSELEMLINEVTALLWGFEYNKRFFSQGTAAQGCFNFKGSAPQSKIDAFRRQWKMMFSGVNNSHRIPMANFDEVQWIDLSVDNQKMGYADWMDWLTKITCGVCQFDPAEIGFNYGNSGQTNQMFSTPVESKLKHSKDKGLRPLLDDLALWFNIHLIWPLDPNFQFAFLGMDAKSTDQAIDLSKKESEFKKTVDEVRAEDDLPPLPDGQGAVILNPVWLQNKQAAEMAAQQEMGEDEGEESQEGQQDMNEVLPQQGDSNSDEYDVDAIFGLDKSMSKKARIKVYEIDL